MRVLILAPFDEGSLTRLRRRADVTHESWLDSNRIFDPEDLGARCAAADVEALIVEADFVFEETLEAAPSLRLVGVCRNALNQVDIDAATQRGVAVTHAPRRNTNAVAEMALGLMLSLARRITPAHAVVSGGGWRDPSFGYRHLRGREIAGSTVGIAGFGQIGRELARKCAALGAKIIAYDPLIPERHIRALGATPVTLRQLAARADFVSLHAPDDDATHHLIDAAFLARMRRGAVLVNTGGGSVVDPAALCDALERGHIAGAALDVFEGQPLPLASPLLAAPNLLLTPHIGGATAETVERHSRMMTAEIERMIDGRPLKHCVNPGWAARHA